MNPYSPSAMSVSGTTFEETVRGVNVQKTSATPGATRSGTSASVASQLPVTAVARGSSSTPRPSRGNRPVKGSERSSGAASRRRSTTPSQIA